MKTPVFVFDLSDINSQLLALAKADSDQTEADIRTRNYYCIPKHGLLWVSRMGVSSQADSLLSWLHLVGEIGMTEQSFRVAEIEHDLQRFRTLDFDEYDNSVNHVAARLEYRLTKACLRYVYGQRFGFVNPHAVFNRLDIEKVDTLGNVLKYCGLFDVSMDLPGGQYYAKVFRKICNDSIAAYLREIQPHDKFYEQLKTMLSQTSDGQQRQRIICNMERARWRRHQAIAEEVKRIIVNIPAYRLYAISPDTTMDMRVVCGAQKTKTPQLSSEIEWMEVNPQWVIPMSIIENEVASHAGDSAYFARHRYHIFDRATNKELGVHEVSRQMLLSGKYRVAQAGGAGNSLGHIVFRFKNNFSVFLHDTSNPGAFLREARAMSHGCVRVAKPFDLAQFVLDNPDEWLLDRIRISMNMEPETDRGIQYVATHPEDDDRKLIGYVPVKPRVPLYIIYYTLWPDADGIVQTWPDVYGYDTVIWEHLQPYMQ